LLTVATAGLEVAATGLGVAWGVLFLFFMAFNLLEASLPSLISKEAPAASKGTAMGVYSTSQFLGAFVGGAIGGLLLQQGGVSGVVWPMVAVLLCWLALALTMPSPSYTSSFVVKLRDISGRDADAVDAALRGHPGVRDVVVLEGTDTAYLKVDREQFEEESLAVYDFVRQGSS